MAVTPVGNPYVESSDLVANYPGASEALAERIDIVGVNPFANAAARDAAIPSPVQGQMCSLNDDNKGYRYDGSAWVLFSGAGDANFTNAATGTYTDGDDYKYITFTGSGSLVVDQAGFADILVIGGGGGGGNDGAGGAGGFVYAASYYLEVGTHTVTIGAGGATGSSSATNGTDSRLLNLYAIGGGFAVSSGGRAEYGGSGGGGSRAPGVGGRGIPGQGFAGGDTNGGGGGSAGVGGNSAGYGGPGTSNSITNTATFYAAGGNRNTTSNTAAGRTNYNTNAAVNSGSGGGAYDGAGGSGGSGVVIVRVVV